MNAKIYCVTGLAVLLLMLWSVNGYAADKIKNCSSAQKTALEAANDYVTNHLDNFLATSANFLPDKYKDKLKKQWPKTTLKCSNADNYCKRKGFAAFQNVGKVLRYCTKEFDLTKNLCSTVAITVHELGHSARIPIHARHNHAGLYSSVSSGTSDLVYRLGNAMRSYCVANTGASPNAPQASSGSIGAMCKKNSDCNSNKCQGKGSVRECVCAKNSDCPGNGVRCKKRLGKNYCLAKGTGPGDFCKKNKDCSIGVCQKKSCVCKTDNDCKKFYVGISDIRCVNRVGKNFCQETNQKLGESCHKNSDCQGSLKCKKKTCSN